MKAAWTALVRQGRSWLGRSRSYEVGGVQLELPAEHLLPEYQAAHPCYDRFLPHLAAQLLPGDAAIDVGANVGDTSAALLAGQGALQLLAIEGDTGFMALLERNAERLRAAHPAAAIHLVQALVGSGHDTVRLRGGDGTRHAVPSPQGRPTVPLAALLAEMPEGFRSCWRLLKCDVDGWDHEVIASAETVLREPLPLLFFECQLASHEHRQRMLALIERLFGKGYRPAVVFDNFGHLLERQADARRIAELIDEVFEQDAGRAPRRMHYLDVLMHGAGDAALVERALVAFEASR